MSKPKLIVMLGWLPSLQSTRLMRCLMAYAAHAGFEVQTVRCHWWYRVYRFLIGKPPAFSLESVAPDDLVIGYRSSCRELVKASWLTDKPHRLVLIEPYLDTGEAFSKQARHVLVFFDSDIFRVDMSSLGHMGTAQNGQTIESYNAMTRSLDHYPTWVWQKIQRSRLTMNLMKLNGNGKEERH